MSDDPRGEAHSHVVNAVANVRYALELLARDEKASEVIIRLAEINRLLTIAQVHMNDLLMVQVGW